MPTQIHVCGMNMPSVWCFPKGPEFSSRPTWLMGLQTDGASLLYDFLSVFYTDSLSKGSADDFPEPVAAKRFFELQASDKDVRLQREHSVQIRGGELQFPKPSLWHWPSKSVDVVVAYVDTSQEKALRRFAEQTRDTQVSWLVLLIAAEATADGTDVTPHLERLMVCAQNTVVVSSAQALALVSKDAPFDCSWEEAAEYWVRAIQTPDPNTPNPLLGRLATAGHLVLRLDSNCALYRSKANGNTPDSVPIKMCFGSERRFGRRQDYLWGYSLFVATGVTCSLSEALGGGRDVQSKDFESGVARGLAWCQIFQRKGYGKEDSAAKRLDVNPNWGKDVVKDSEGEIETIKADFAWVPVPPMRTGWSIVVEKLTSDPPTDRILEAAMDIVCRGLEYARRKHKFPSARFGDVAVVDRVEFEQFAQVARAMNGYLHMRPREWKPLSWAVFGRPGGGKSFGIKQVARSLENPLLDKEPIEANVSQFSDAEDLAVVFQRARDVTLRGKVPLVLLDEFDAPWNGQQWGWLQLFLAPMQDGIFRHGKSAFHLGRSILVFVGGINHSFEMLEGRLRNEDFVKAKGPDFASRLRGHLNVLGVSRQSERDKTYPLQRAVMLRKWLVDHQPSIQREDGQLDIADDVVRALLRVRDYKHGTRSMEAIIIMCNVSPVKRKLEWASLPGGEQLEMHVSRRDLERERA